MTVRDLLKQIAPLLSTHEFCTLWGDGYTCTLIVDIIHNHNFHACCELTRNDIDRSSQLEYVLTQPFEHSYYKSYAYKKKEDVYLSVLNDMTVYRWKLNYEDNQKRIWKLEIETHQS